MSKKSITITREDIDYNLTPVNDFVNIFNCPLAKACKRILNEDNITVSLSSIYSNKHKIGKLEKGFYYEEYSNLRDNITDKFQTELILN